MLGSNGSGRPGGGDDDWWWWVSEKQDYPKGKRKARKQRHLRRGIKDVRRRRKAEVVSDDLDSSSKSSE
ncbi:hypothetical protein Tco_0510880 [Tanacetum coccineum]